MEIVRRKIEGLILSKIPFQERHMVCSLLGRNGRKISVLFYGGQGGGPKKKSSNLDLGTMVWVELSPSRSTERLHRAREWDTLWRHEKIREHYPTFSHLCFYLEVMAKLSPEDDLFGEEAQVEGHRGLFRVASNGVYLLEKNMNQRTRNLFFESSLFLGKLLIAEGLFPEVGRCILTGEKLDDSQGFFLLNDLGGMALGHALGAGHDSPYPLAVHQSLGPFLQEVARRPYHHVGPRASVNRASFELLLDYCLYQFHLARGDLRTYGALGL